MIKLKPLNWAIARQGASSVVWGAPIPAIGGSNLNLTLVACACQTSGRVSVSLDGFARTSVLIGTAIPSPDYSESPPEMAERLFLDFLEGLIDPEVQP